MSEYEKNKFLDKLSKKYNLCQNIIFYLLNIKSENKFKKNRRDLWYISNPIGWGAALVIAVGSTAISYGAGKLGRTMYDIYGNKIDIVSGMGVSKICK